jgi:muramoyltetrapeptide carboxypeptidase
MRPLLRARALRRGDRIALLTLASGARAEDVERGADELRGLGFEPVVGATRNDAAPYVAGSAEYRAGQLHEALHDHRIAAIVATRGGYGSAQLLPYLDIAVIRTARTLLIGYSDITALLEVWTGHAGITSVHGPMAEGRLARGTDGYDREGFLRIVCEPRAYGTVTAPEATVVQRGTATGVLRGGTLTQLAALAGTPWAFRPEEPTILFLDDVNERPYRIDRLLWQLQYSGALAAVTGIIVNELPGCDEPGGAITGLDAVGHALRQFTGPIVAGVASGHTTRSMLTLPFGVACSLTADDVVRVSIDEPAVE